MDFSYIEKLLKQMTPQSKLFKLVKAEMKRRGYWKNKARGKAFAKNNEHAKKKK